jgi:hypothetical protein
VSTRFSSAARPHPLVPLGVNVRRRAPQPLFKPNSIRKPCPTPIRSATPPHPLPFPRLFQIWTYEGASPSTRFGRAPRTFDTTTDATMFRPTSLRLSKLFPADGASMLASPPRKGSRFQDLPVRYTLKLGHGAVGEA